MTNMFYFGHTYTRLYSLVGHKLRRVASNNRDFKILERGHLEERLGRTGPGTSERCSPREN